MVRCRIGGEPDSQEVYRDLVVDSFLAIQYGSLWIEEVAGFGVPLQCRFLCCRRTRPGLSMPTVSAAIP